MKSKTSTSRNTIYFFLGILAPQFLGFLLLPVFTAYLSPKEFGIISYVATVNLFIQQVGTLSLGAYLMRYYFVYDSISERKELAGTIVVMVLLWNTVTYSVSALLLFLSMDLLGIKVGFHPYFSLGLFTGYLETIAILPLVILRIRENALGYVLLSVIPIGLKYILSLTLIVGFGMGILGRFYSDLLIAILAIPAYWLVLRSDVVFVLKRSLIRPALLFSLPFLGSSFLYSVVDSSDRLFLERYTNLGVLGVYSVAVMVVSGLGGLVQSLYRALEPSFYREHGKSGFTQFVLVKKRDFFFLVLVFALGVLLFSPELLSVMTRDRFSGAVPAIRLLVIATIAASIRMFYDTLLVSYKKSYLMIVETTIGAVAVVCLNVLLIPYWGQDGAAVAKIGAYSLMASVSVFGVSRLVSIEVWQNNLKLGIVGFGFLVPAFFLDTWLHATGFLILVGVKFFYWLTFVALLGKVSAAPIWSMISTRLGLVVFHQDSRG